MKAPTKFLLILIVFFLLKIPTITQPLINDELSLVDASVRLVNNRAISANSTFVGHVPLVNYTLAVLISIIGFSLAVPHLFSIACSIIALCFVFLIVNRISGQFKAMLITILVAATPIFFTQAGILNLDMPATAMLLGFTYFLICERWFFAVFFASLSGLTKETTLVGVMIAIAWLYLKNLQNPLKFIRRRWYLSIPFLLVILWFVFCKAFNGWFFYPGHSFFFLKNPNGFNAAIGFVFIAGWRFLLIPFFLIWRKNRQIVILLLAMVIGGTLFGGLIFKERYLLPLLPLFFIAYAISTPKHWSFTPLVLILIIAALAGMFPGSIDPNETSMGYLNTIKFYKQGFLVLDNEYPGLSLLSPWPHTEQAKSQLWGYTKSKRPVFSVLEKYPYLPELAISSSLQDPFIPRYPALLKKYYSPSKTISFMGKNLTIYRRV